MEQAQDTGRHGLKIVTAACVGCSHCMRVCPTEALRVTGGKAVIHYDWCIDCGECYRVCPGHAIRVADDDLRQIAGYEHRILLLSSTFYAELGDRATREQIDDYLLTLGFTEVCPVEQGADVLASELAGYVATHAKPVISSYCPAIVRLIQVRFPVLVDHIMHLMPPLEVTALYYKRSLEEKGVDPGDIGIFYATPCAAKIAAIKNPIGGYESPITGVINMDQLYNKIYRAYKNHELGDPPPPRPAAASARGVRWLVTGGEAKHAGGRTLSIDGMANVIDFLEQLENDEIRGIDYLELRTCDESCSGGILTNSHRFLTVEHLKAIERQSPEEHPLAGDYRRLCSAHIPMDPVEPRSLVKYDKDIKLALGKMEKARELCRQLPGIDCGACGAPSCKALSEDVVCRDVPLGSCIFMQAKLEKQGAMSFQQGIGIMESVWGEQLFRDKH